MDELTGSIEGTVGEENGLGIGAWLANGIGIDVLRGTYLAAFVGGFEKIASTGLGGEGEEAIGVGVELRLRDTVALVVELPQIDFGLGHGFAGVGFKDKTFNLAVAWADDEGEVADPNVGVAHDIVGCGEFRVVAGDQKIESGFEGAGRGDFLGALFVINRGR